MPQKPKRRRPKRSRRFVIRGFDPQLLRYLKLLTRDGFYGDRSPQAVAVRLIGEGIRKRLEEGCPIIKAEIGRIQNKTAKTRDVRGASPLRRTRVELHNMIFRGNQAAAIEELADGFFGPLPEDVVRFLVTERLEKMRLENSPFLQHTAARIAAQA
jgi:hypothetical protein